MSRGAGRKNGAQDRIAAADTHTLIQGVAPLLRRESADPVQMTERVARSTFLIFFAVRFSSSVRVGFFRCSFFRF
jgi:hypothetical protein